MRSKYGLPWFLVSGALCACSVVNRPDDPFEGVGGGGGGPVACSSNEECVDDGNPCTLERCANGQCATDTTNPDDQDACTDDSCDSAGMAVNTPIDFDDGDDCTWDVCDPMTGPANPDALVIFEETFAAGGADWTITAPWAVGAAAASPVSVTAQGFVPPLIARDPASDHSRSDDEMLAGVVIGGFAATTPLPPGSPLNYLESPAIDATVTEGKVVLRYWRYLVSDYRDYMNNTVEVFDGTDWRILVQNDMMTPWADAGWVEVSHDISTFASDQLKVRFGFGVQSAGAFSDMPSWSVDDVQVLHFREYEDDNDPCTVDACDAGAPVHNPVTLDDADPCTEDRCDPVQGLRNRDRSIRLLLDFSSPAFGVTPGPEWQVGPAIMASGDPGMDTTEGDDNRIAGVVLGGNYAVTVHALSYLSTMGFDASTPVGTLELSFQRWIVSDYEPYVSNRVEVLGPPGPVVLWTNGTTALNDTQWMPQTFDITAPTAGNPNAIVRFGFAVNSGAYAAAGWNVDDIVVRDLGCPMP